MENNLTLTVTIINGSIVTNERWTADLSPPTARLHSSDGVEPSPPLYRCV